MFRLDDQQGLQLEAIMIATRPDWAPRNPGRMLHQANPYGFPHAADYPHMIRALAVYATQPDSHGKPFGRNMDGYLKDGHHWTSTAPPDYLKPRGPRCKTHTTFDADTCPPCAADRIAERRPDPYESLPPDPRWANRINLEAATDIAAPSIQGETR